MVALIEGKNMMGAILWCDDLQLDTLRYQPQDGAGQLKINEMASSGYELLVNARVGGPHQPDAIYLDAPGRLQLVSALNAENFQCINMIEGDFVLVTCNSSPDHGAEILELYLVGGALQYARTICKIGKQYW